MDAVAHAQGDALASALIAQYWREFSTGRTWNYYSWTSKCVANDHWAGPEDWLAAALQCVQTEHNLISAYEILLAEGRTEFQPQAIALVKQWDAQSGHDANYFFKLMAHLPAQLPVREKYLAGEPLHYPRRSS